MEHLPRMCKNLCLTSHITPPKVNEARILCCYLPLSLALFLEGHWPSTVPAIARFGRLGSFPCLGTWHHWVKASLKHGRCLCAWRGSSCPGRWAESSGDWSIKLKAVAEMESSGNTRTRMTTVGLFLESKRTKQNKNQPIFSLDFQFLNHFLLHWSKLDL